MSRTLHSVRSDCEWKLWATCNNNSTAEYHYVLSKTSKTILYVSIIFITLSLLSVSKNLKFLKGRYETKCKELFPWAALTFLSMLWLLPGWNWTVTKSSTSVWKKATPLQRSSTIPNHQLNHPLTVSVCSSKSLFCTQTHSHDSAQLGSWEAVGREVVEEYLKMSPAGRTPTLKVEEENIWAGHIINRTLGTDLTQKHLLTVLHIDTHICMCETELCRQEVS